MTAGSIYKSKEKVVSHITGSANVLACISRLRLLAEYAGQSAELSQLAYYLDLAGVRSKTPHLLLIGSSEDDLTGAVLLNEYRFGRIATHLFMPLDFTGLRTIIAPELMRREVGQIAADYLLRHGALAVLLSAKDVNFAPDGNSADGNLVTRYCYAAQVRSVRYVFELGKTVEETFAQFGADTRRNLRRYPARAVKDLGARFMANAEISEEEFYALNEISQYPEAKKAAQWIFRNTRDFDGVFFSGVQGSDGKWLSMVGGRRAGGVTDLDWQMNIASLKPYSLSTVLRAWLIEDEVSRGTRFLRFDGGTTHSMQNAFAEDNIGDLLMTRRFIGRKLWRRACSRFLPPDSAFGNIVNDSRLHWYDRNGDVDDAGVALG